jgi:glutathione synthase/RimK-type ligase-like ATP-grasp enzyme
MFDLVVLRSCWNYHRHLAAFRRWLDRLEAAGVPLWNPPAVLRWNLDKGYLRDLAGAGLPIVPTVWLDAGAPAQLAAILETQGWERAVVKPRVSASAHGIWRVDRAAAAQKQPEFEQLLMASGAMVQPLMPQIADGEWSFIFFRGECSHTVLKTPGADDIFVQQRLGGTSVLHAAPPSLVEQAAALLRAATARLLPDEEPLLYARVDGLNVGGQLVLMELELTEPGLFLDLAPPEAPARFADAITGALRRR